MPAVNVARTDTFEQQRIKINQIGDQLFNVTSGGSDLAAGNIKLGDGTQTAPSLAFDSDATLGFYKPRTGTIGYVSSSKKIFDITSLDVLFYKDVNIRQEKISDTGITFNSFGQNYDTGSYGDILLTGGTGSGAIANFSVTAFDGTLVTGSGYIEGDYTSILMAGGAGTGAEAEFSVPGIEGQITNAGSGYVPGFYQDVPLTGGTGSGAEAEITVVGDVVINGSITNAGSGYATGSYTNVTVFNTPAQTFVVTANGTSNFIIDGTPSASITVNKANSYRFDVSDPTNAGHILVFKQTNGDFIGSEFVALYSGTAGNAGAFVDLIISDVAPTGTYEYDCQNHPGMSGQLTVGTGTTGIYGRYALVDIEVDASGNITDLTFVSTGSNYKATDTFTIDPNATGNGSGFLYTVSSLSYNGTIDNVTLTASGSGYSPQDELSANDVDLGGGGGSNFTFTVSNSPGIPIGFNFITKGSGYQVGDQLTLPTGVSGLTTTVTASVIGLATVLSTSSTQITVSSTTGILQGMQVFGGGTDPGQLAPETTVASVDGPTTLTLSASPISDGSATLDFQPAGNSSEITVSSTTGILAGSFVTQTGGTGSIPAGTTVFSVVDETTLILSTTPTQSGSLTLSFAPPYGTPTTPLTFTIDALGVVDEFILADGGVGYTVGDIISVDPTDLVQPNVIIVTVKTLQTLEFPASTYAAGTFSVGGFVKQPDGQVTSISPSNSGTTLAGQEDAIYAGVSVVGGSGTGLTVTLTRDSIGALSNWTIDTSGTNYAQGDPITILGTSVGGATPADDIEFFVDTVTESTDLEVYRISESGGFVNSILVDSSGISDGDVIVKIGSATQYTVDSASGITYRYFFDDQLTPNLTLYAGNSYQFDVSDTTNDAHGLAFSEFRDGPNPPSAITNLTTTLSSSSPQITVSSTVGILPGMLVVEVLSDGGALIPDTRVLSVDDATTVTLTKTPLTSGGITVSFTGFTYTDGVSSDVGTVTLKVTDETPTLYYFDANGINDLGGEDNAEGVLTIDSNNPKVFGSGFNFTVAILQTTDVISSNVTNGEFRALEFIGDEATITNATIQQTLESNTVVSPSLQVTNITSADTGNTITLTADNFTLDTNVDIGDTIEITAITGKIQTTGEIKTLNQFNSNDALFISSAEISSATATDIELSPAANRVAKVNGTTALIIPSGNNTDRPGPGIVDDGAIRFNTQTNQYEGYSTTTTSWSSLGGVRDIDGNTYILAEESVGANDNKLWFYNDDVLSLRLTKDWMEFMNADAIRSLNTAAPAYSDWRANTLVTAGEYLKYASSIYFVVSTGTTATSGNEPSDTSGNDFTNGSATLRWHVTAVKDLLFSEIATLKVGSTVDTLPLSINGDLRLRQNIISTDTSDLLLKPNTGKKVVIDTVTSLVIPVGSENDKGSASTGSIRYNTTNQNFEGFNGAQWGSLGGVKDVDQNTYIIPETSPGANENILYFYNNNVNTLNVTETELRFEGINTITTPFDNSLEITTSTFTLDNSATTIDNTNLDRSVLSTSKQYLDLALSTGLNVDPVLRLDDLGDVYLNVGFGSGVFDGVKVFDKDLSAIEIAKYKIVTAVTELTKGGTESGATVLYDPGSDRSSRVEVVVHNTTTGNKEFIELSVIDNGPDIFFTEIGTVQTGGGLIDYTLDFNVQGNVRFNFSLNSSVSNTHVVNITVVSRVIKK
jgi:hypothetical protein